jgi:L-Ala-D/L-Glu epimerase
VGCMLGGSVSVAPGMVLAQQCEVSDLDGPWLQAEDWPQGVAYHQGRMSLPASELWG